MSFDAEEAPRWAGPKARRPERRKTLDTLQKKCWWPTYKEFPIAEGSPVLITEFVIFRRISFLHYLPYELP
jgi:hypothetical protein